MELTAERLREVLDYDPDTGVFTRKICIGNARVGDVAGNICNGYIQISVDGREHSAHRLAWLYTYGVWPTHQVDHENEIKTDNRLSNLRSATSAQNHQNHSKPRSDNKSGYLGVSYDRTRRKWTAHIQIDKVDKNLGRFTTPEEASEAYLAAKQELHPFWSVR